jgi:hypothetical protein
MGSFDMVFSGHCMKHSLVEMKKNADGDGHGQVGLYDIGHSSEPLVHASIKFDFQSAARFPFFVVVFPLRMMPLNPDIKTELVSAAANRRSQA